MGRARAGPRPASLPRGGRVRGGRARAAGGRSRRRRLPGLALLLAAGAACVQVHVPAEAPLDAAALARAQAVLAQAPPSLRLVEGGLLLDAHYTVMRRDTGLHLSMDPAERHPGGMQVYEEREVPVRAGPTRLYLAFGSLRSVRALVGPFGAELELGMAERPDDAVHPEVQRRGRGEEEEIPVSISLPSAEQARELADAIDLLRRAVAAPP